MPITLSLPHRRSFLRFIAASGGFLTVRRSNASHVGTDPHRLALLSDTHIPDTPTVGDRNCNMTHRLRQVVEEIVALNPKPCAAVVNGDLAWKLGTPSEYQRFAAEVTPFQQAGIPLHATLGNHDALDAFRAGLKEQQPKTCPVASKHVLVVELERADLILLDSLAPKLGVPGELGTKQLEWLAAALTNRPTKPALVFVHHNPQWANSPPNGIGLTDTTALWNLLRKHDRVQALIYGHTHTFRHDRRDGIHLLNLPAIGYPFQEKEVTGWLDVHMKENGATLKLQAINKQHEEHGKQIELKWR